MKALAADSNGMAGPAVTRPLRVRKLLLICGILATLLYVGGDILAALRWEGYSYTAQSVTVRKEKTRRRTMINIFKKQNGMSIVGQGGKIILFVLPSLMAAMWVHTYLPQIAALPKRTSFIKPVGYLLLLPGLILWGTAVIQLVTSFPKGKLVTTGAYGVVRNPIYSSVTFFILPAVALLTLTWVYLVVSVFLYVGVMIFIGKEEKQLTKAFGKEYEEYMARVDRLVPLKKP